MTNGGEPPPYFYEVANMAPRKQESEQVEQVELTPEQHNDQVFAKVSQLRAEIDELLKSLKPIQAKQEVDLVTCNAGALSERFAEFERRDAAKAAVELALSAAKV